MEELIEKLKANIKYHIRPYNLGDCGETETLIMELIRKYDAQQREWAKFQSKSKGIFVWSK